MLSPSKIQSVYKNEQILSNLSENLLLIETHIIDRENILYHYNSGVSVII